MRNCVLTEKSRFFMRGVALVVLAGFGAGCSADMSRFTSRDFTTGSVNQQQIIRKAAKPQPFPAGESAQASEDFSDASMDVVPETTNVGGVTRRALAPVASNTKSALAPASAARQTVTPVQLASVEDEEPALAPVSSAPKKLKKKAVEVLDDTTTGTVKPAVRKIDMSAKKIKPLAVEEETDAQPKLKRVAPVAAAKSADRGGWTKEGGTLVTVRQGETIYNFSKRFGVPVESLLKANGLSDASQVQAGQQLVVPAYRYSQNSDVSAPDSNFDTAAAKSSSGTIYDVPGEKVPLPHKAPSRENVAVLPSIPSVKQKTASANVAAVDPKTTSKTDRIRKLQPIVQDEAAAVEQPAAPVREVQVAKIEVPKVDMPKAEAKKSVPAGSYAVAQGDSLYKIAKNHGISVVALKAANGLGDDGKLKIGQPLKIPAQGEAVAAAPKANVDMIQTSAAGQNAKLLKPKLVEEAKVKEYTPPKADAVTAEADQDDSAAPNATGIGKLRWPVRGRTVTGYGQRNAGVVNDGIDISVPEGTPIKAAENGVVIYAGSGLKEFGNTVLVRHANGLVTVYGHASELKVKRGQTIKRGQELAAAGRTGNATAPKLHFEVRKDSAPVDPSGYLE
jgi:murein DD-endopeptidase MepM/ murein hydrolase activator NlpD